MENEHQVLVHEVTRHKTRFASRLWQSTLLTNEIQSSFYRRLYFESTEEVIQKRSKLQKRRGIRGTGRRIKSRRFRGIIE